MSLAFDALLCLLLLAVALGAVLARETYAVVMLFMVLGLFAAVAWVRLGAVDVALAEAAIGAGLTGVLLVRAAARLPTTPDRTPWRVAAPRRALGAVLALGVFGALAAFVLDPPATSGLAGPVRAQLGATGVSHPVTAVLLDFRGYDTLLETVVLLMALVGAWSLCADRDWGQRPGHEEHARAQGLLVSFARVLPPLALLVALHLFWAGATGPGGAFQAGTVLAAVALLVALAGQGAPAGVTDWRLRLAAVFGPALFLLFAAGALPSGGFLDFPQPLAKAAVLVIEAGLTASIAATLALLVLGAPARRA
ncbi:hydrogenase subunit MbhD domain-containing protein [Ramlibacter rhizophilus]|uniref:DUF4040 domain-containing protein n=1 Tax=Ramlibacter rhizophilus TaxID=1781167 RepID=A0A4Z0BZU0_9BURK|nr:hydrogenase subunit MbhD domain-containing protein [Ramlibacter rhizophilus]TFZ04192.1 DUF4040 domain-containing protein [Ramlibacter rhizophilus]